MPLSMDRHELAGATAADLEAAHLKDLEAQSRFGVEYLNHWFDYERQHAFCLARGPDAEVPMGVRIGVAAGEPVSEGGAKAEPRSILVASSVRDLAVGKRFTFGPVRSLRLLGFDEPVRACACTWEAGPHTVEDPTEPA